MFYRYIFFIFKPPAPLVFWGVLPANTDMGRGSFGHSLAGLGVQRGLKRG